MPEEVSFIRDEWTTWRREDDGCLYEVHSFLIMDTMVGIIHLHHGHLPKKKSI